MTPDKLVELLGDPKVAQKLGDMLDSQPVRDALLDLLDDPAVAHKVSAILRGAELPQAVAGYAEVAMGGAAVLLGLGVLTLLAMFYNILLARRVVRAVRAAERR